MKYGWPHAEEELAIGINPELVAARLRTSITHLLAVAASRRWIVLWKAAHG